MRGVFGDTEAVSVFRKHGAGLHDRDERCRGVRDEMPRRFWGRGKSQLLCPARKGGVMLYLDLLFCFLFGSFHFRFDRFSTQIRIQSANGLAQRAVGRPKHLCSVFATKGAARDVPEDGNPVARDLIETKGDQKTSSKGDFQTADHSRVAFALPQVKRGGPKVVTPKVGDGLLTALTAQLPVGPLIDQNPA